MVTSTHGAADCCPLGCLRPCNRGSGRKLFHLLELLSVQICSGKQREPWKHTGMVPLGGPQRVLGQKGSAARPYQTPAHSLPASPLPRIVAPVTGECVQPTCLSVWGPQSALGQPPHGPLLSTVASVL